MESIPHASGVYVIQCLASGKMYIGSSVDIADRLFRHRSQLRRGINPNHHLQAAFTTYGEATFTFSVLEFTDASVRVERENYWIVHFNAANRQFGYNNRTDAVTQTHSEETKARIAAKHGTPDARMRQSERMREQFQDPRRRALQSEHAKRMRARPEDRQRNADKMRAQNQDKEFRAMVTASSHSPEAQRKRSETLKGRKPSANAIAAMIKANAKSYVVTDPSGTEYRVTNLAKFCREHGLLPPNMHSVARGEQSHCHGWTCRYA